MHAKTDRLDNFIYFVNAAHPPLLWKKSCVLSSTLMTTKTPPKTSRSKYYIISPRVNTVFESDFTNFNVHLRVAVISR